MGLRRATTEIVSSAWTQFEHPIPCHRNPRAIITSYITGERRACRLRESGAQSLERPPCIQRIRTFRRSADNRLGREAGVPLPPTRTLLVAQGWPACFAAAGVTLRRRVAQAWDSGTPSPQAALGSAASHAILAPRLHQRACLSAVSPPHNSVKYVKFQFSGGSRASI
jgi:hypothetical protein